MEFLISSISHILRDILKQGYLTRGGISLGSLYHEKQIIFGEALIAAISLEKDKSKKPRILLSEEANSEFDKYLKEIGDEQRKFKTNWIQKDKNDQKPYINYLYTYWSSSNLIRNDYIEIRKKIASNLEKFKNESEIFKKWSWFAQYFNDVIRIDSIEGAYGPRIDIDQFNK